MKIIYLHQYFTTPGMSGGTRSYEMAFRMVAAGHEVHMVTSCTDGTLEGSNWCIENVEGIWVHWLPVKYSNTMGFLRRLFAFAKFARKAGSYASTLSGDVVLATSTPLTIALPGVKVSRKLKVPLVFEVRDLWPDVPIAIGALRFFPARWLALRFERWAYQNSQHVVALSPGIWNGVARTGYPEDRISCIPNSADLELFQRLDHIGQQFRLRRSWLQNRPLVLYAGTFGRVNGVAYMVELAAEMRKINSEVRFLAVGSGAEVGAVKKRARELGVLEQNFFVQGPVLKREVPVLFNAATVCSSWVINVEALWNNSANKVFDAFAAGKPVVINYGGWQRELLEMEGAGLFLSSSDIGSAARQLNDFLSDEPSVKRAGEAALALAKNRFSRDILSHEVIRILEKVVQANA